MTDNTAPTLANPATFTPEQAGRLALQNMMPMLRAIRESIGADEDTRQAAIAWKLWVLALIERSKSPAAQTNPAGYVARHLDPARTGPHPDVAVATQMLRRAMARSVGRPVTTRCAGDQS